MEYMPIVIPEKKSFSSTLLIVGILGVAAVGLFIYFMNKNKTVNADPKIDGLSLSVSSLTAGQSGTATVSIHNTSIATGTTTKVPYTFYVTISSSISGLSVIKDAKEDFDADQIRTISFPFNVPSTASGGVTFTANIYNSSNSALIGSKTATVTIGGGGDVNPAGTVAWL